MESLTFSLIIIFAAVTFVPSISKRIGLPVIVVEILFGIILGKSLFDIIPEHSTIDFFSSFGLTYLMFLAGLEINFKRVKEHFSPTVLITLFSIIVPLLAGVAISSYVGMHPLFLGTILSTTSLGIILPLIRELRYKKEFSHILLGSVVLVDTLSMFLLAFSLATIQGSLESSFFYSLLAILTLFIIPWLINRWSLHKRIADWVSEESHFDMEVRFSFALILILAAIADQLGFHSIIGAFIAGLIISELTSTGSVLEEKLESFGYGFFIPLFFILMGAKVDLPALFSNLEAIQLLLVIVAVGILSKVVGVSLIARIKVFNFCESVAFGLFHSARVSLVIAAIEVGRKLGLIDTNLFSIFVILAITSALVGPSLGRYILGSQQLGRVYNNRSGRR
ncbi:MAG: cation:proton antiporter [Candidatus Bipolaricaulia bacterium]